MKKNFFDGDNQNEVRQFAIDGQSVLKRPIPNDLSLAADPQGVAVSGNDENQSDVGADQQVFKRIQPVVAEPVRDGERLLIEDSNEACGIALGRNVQSAVEPA